MGRFMMRATSPEEEIERPDCCLYASSAPPTTTPEPMPVPWLTTSSSPTITLSTPSPSPNHSPPQVTPTSSLASPSFPPTSPTRSTRTKRRRSHPASDPQARFSEANIQKARDDASESQDWIERRRRRDLLEGRRRSQWHWLRKRTCEKQPTEVLMKLRRLQFEAARREMAAMGMKPWEIAGAGVQGDNGLRVEIKYGEEK